MDPMLLQSTAGAARLGLEDPHRMRNRLLILANGLPETARIRSSNPASAPPTRGPMTGIGDYPGPSCRTNKKVSRLASGLQ
jgi:hypothetical protein